MDRQRRRPNADESAVPPETSRKKKRRRTIVGVASSSLSSSTSLTGPPPGTRAAGPSGGVGRFDSSPADWTTRATIPGVGAHLSDAAGGSLRQGSVLDGSRSSALDGHHPSLRLSTVPVLAPDRFRGIGGSNTISSLYQYDPTILLQHLPHVSLLPSLFHASHRLSSLPAQYSSHQQPLFAAAALDGAQLWNAWSTSADVPPDRTLLRTMMMMTALTGGAPGGEIISGSSSSGNSRNGSATAPASPWDRLGGILTTSVGPAATALQLHHYQYQFHPTIPGASTLLVPHIGHAMSNIDRTQARGALQVAYPFDASYASARDIAALLQPRASLPSTLTETASLPSGPPAAAGSIRTCSTAAGEAGRMLAESTSRRAPTDPGSTPQEHRTGPRMGRTDLENGTAAAGPYEAAATSVGPCRVVPMSRDAADAKFASRYQCLIREQIEYFEADEDALHAKAQGRNVPIRPRQVGIRCAHCARQKPGGGGGREDPAAALDKAEDKAASGMIRGAVYYPTSLANLYQAVQNMANNHFANRTCPSAPSSLLDEIAEARRTRPKRSGGKGKMYFVQSAEGLGIANASAGSGLFFEAGSSTGKEAHVSLPVSYATPPSHPPEGQGTSEV